MIKEISISVFSFLLLLNVVAAQGFDDEIDPVLIKLKGQIVNIDDGLPIPYVHVVNMRTHGGTTTDASGKFILEMLNVDSLAISVIGFKKMYIQIDPRYNENNLYTIHAIPVRFAIKEVEVKGERKEVDLGLPEAKSVDISPELRGDGYNSKPPIIAALFNPLSFLQYHLSDDEKEKREVRKAIVSEERWQMLSKYYSKEVVMNLTGLNETDADKFMLYFNSKGILNHTSSEYDVRAAIIGQYELWLQEPAE
ncbi:MAG: hypothetical protein A2W90_06680 [Bacteroidetes bacterium GWF2_42_66]|nr:MAG: hypothetical protein A2W92_01980 [Bacteroidetes bacterium GWA2_42_15]OFY02839.1 MAG: hypothetical protein A2W89_24090 [Bacteroidetes bacterium GWE2_42_39]OFY44493.1 MAG: hypothetical protein A2W90_06680 [Bacteroidetes bacterium GWF2_42_66]HAZ04659.1 hypothetical protein [Marinilabiliales bacterium]HBL74961.1 hypothetical protein [Prolixibacteraceae bacterium]